MPPRELKRGEQLAGPRRTDASDLLQRFAAHPIEPTVQPV
jgi:hypothetical protein